MVFYPPVLRLYLMLSIPAQVVLSAILVWEMVLEYRRNGAGPTEGDALAGAGFLTGVGVLLLPAAALLAFFGRITIGGLGLEVPGRLGLRRFIHWDVIESVEPARVLWVRYLKLRTITGRPAWLPENRAERYCEVIVFCAGEDHPLSRALASSQG